MSPKTSTDQPRLVSIKTVCTMTSMSRSMINALRADGNFAEAVELGPRRIAFVRDEIESWIDSRIAARTTDGNNITADTAAETRRHAAVSTARLAFAES